MRKGILTGLASLALTMLCFGQSAVGEWRTHFSYKNANQVVIGNDLIYAEANGKLYTYNLTSEQIQTYTTLSGLGSHTVVQLGFSDSQKCLLIAYSDGNMDFLTASGSIINLPDFKNKSLTGDKTIYGLRVYGDYAYLSTGVGLLVIDLKKKEIADTYYLNFSSSPTKCLDAAVVGDSLYVATVNGLFKGAIKDNLQDLNYWKSDKYIPSKKSGQLVSHAGLLYSLNADGSLYSLQNGLWNLFLYDPALTRIQTQDTVMMANAGFTTYFYDNHLNRIPVTAYRGTTAAWDEKRNKLVISSSNQGVTILKNQNSSFVVEKDSLIPEGPVQKTAWNGFFQNGTYYATAGARWGDRYFYEGDVLKMEGEQWSSLPDKNALIQATGYIPLDFVNMAVDPKDDSHYFITSWGDGLFEYRKNKFYKQYKPGNSPLNNIIPGRFCRVDGAVFDEDGNLWMLNSKYSPYITYPSGFTTDTALLILKKDGTWFQPVYPKLKTSPTWNSIMFTSAGQVWMNSARYNYGVFVLDNKGTLTNLSDDESRMFQSFTDQDGNVLAPWTICCMAEDKKGTIWLGTEFGPILANGVSDIFESDYTFTRIKIPRNDGTNNADYLLKDIRINCIAIDGANRKWLGTNGNGVYLLSADGIKTIHHFTTENSPLPSGYIWSLAIHPVTGEVFIGTDAGLVSYRSDANEGTKDFSGVHVFPNPVRPEYNGLITVTGLTENAQVSITDLSGNLIVKGNSLGGQFSWDGSTKSGKKAASGVYLVFAASEDGTLSEACRFMIVR